MNAHRQTATKDEQEKPRSIALEIPIRTIITVIAACLVCTVIYMVRDFLLLLVIAALIAVTLQPLLDYTMRRGFSRRAGLGLIITGYLACFSAFFFFLIPPFFTELGSLSNTIPGLHAEIVKNTPSAFGLRRALTRVLATPFDAGKTLESVISIGQYAAGGIVSFIMLSIFSIYFLIDGEGTYRWLIPYFSLKNQRKISQTIDEVAPVVSAYISGQFITSVAVGIFSFVVLFALKVPAALSLSMLAAIFDILPFVGFFFYSIPACLLALTVSWQTALYVALAFILYQQIEDYIIIPRVYGHRLRLSGLVILIGIVVAGTVAGVLGAIAVLPLLASYPIIERIWLVKHVGTAVVEEHSQVEES